MTSLPSLETLADYEPIESTFATVRPPIRSKGSLLKRTALAMVFNLVEAQESWRRLDGTYQATKNRR